MKKVKAFLTSVMLGVAMLMSSQAAACTQDMADRLAARTETEWAADVLEEYPVAGTYVLRAVKDETFSFELVRKHTGEPPLAFATEIFTTLSCTFGFNDWWKADRAPGDQVVVFGHLARDSAFEPWLLYALTGPEAVLLLKAVPVGETVQ